MLKHILLLLALTTSISSACLEATVLKDMGYANTTDAKKIDPASVCKELFSTVGTCVPEADVQKRIESETESLSDAINVSKGMAETLKTLSDAVKDNADHKKLVEDIKLKIEGDQTACVTAWSTVQQGVVCYLASAAASENTSVSATEVAVTVNTDTVGAELDKCLDFLDGVCILQTGISISGDITITEADFQTGKEMYESSCKTLKENYSATDAAGKKKRYETIIKLYKPFDHDLFPNNSLLDKAKKTLEDTFDKVKDFFSRERQLASDEDVILKPGSGRDLVKDGNDSGLDKAKAKTSLIKSIVSIAVMLMVFK